jgi:hypothetical protein
VWQEIRVRSGRDDNSFWVLTFPLKIICHPDRSAA